MKELLPGRIAHVVLAALIAAYAAIAVDSLFARTTTSIDRPTVWGPRKFVRTKGAPNDYTAAFRADPDAGPFLLRVTNGDARGGHRASSAATITLNSVDVLTPRDFSQKVGTIDRVVSLRSSNTLRVTLASAPDSYLVINVLGPTKPPFGLRLTPDPLKVIVGRSETLTATLNPRPRAPGIAVVTTAARGIVRISSPIAFRAGTYAIPIPVTGVAVGRTAVTVTVHVHDEHCHDRDDDGDDRDGNRPRRGGGGHAGHNHRYEDSDDDHDGDDDHNRPAVATATVIVESPPVVNRPPTAAAGGPYSGRVGQPISFAGSASDPDGDPLTFSWNFGDGAIGTGATPMHAYARSGQFTATLTVEDGRGGRTTASARVSVDDPAPVNQPPVVSAGADQSITLPATATLHGTVTDDGLPPGATVTTQWSQMSGPGTVTFSNAASVTTEASFSAAGTYVLRLTASDTLLSAFADVTVTVNPAPPVNQSPVVTAGADQSITLPASATLQGTVTDDGLPAGATLTLQWSQVSGPGTVTFTHAAGVTTEASFSAAGTFVLRLTASDTLLSAFADVTVTVNPAPVNQPPVVTAGADQTITLPASATLQGTVTDDGLPAGATLTLQWGQVSGPGTVTFTHAASATTEASFSAAGTYVLRLAASDTLLTAFDDVAVTVNPPINKAPVVTAGADQKTTYPYPATLTGVVSDDGLPAGATLQITWTRVSGPGTVTFALASATATTANFSAPGTYVLRLTATDSLLQAADEVTVVVEPPPPPPEPVNHDPEANAGGPYQGEVNAPIAFNARQSSDPDGDALSFLWNFGDGATATGPAPVHAYERHGTFVVTLTVHDGRGGPDTATASAVIALASDRSPPVITLAAPREVLPGTDVTVTADAADNVAVASVTISTDATTGVPIAAPPYERVVSIPPVAAPGSTIRVRAVARDAAGNMGTAEATLTIGALPDTEPPTVSLSVPPHVAPGETTRITSEARDNVGVRSVEFLAVGIPFTTDTTVPFEATFAVPASAPAGSSLQFTARAVDHAGNRATSDASVPVVALADVVPPTIVLSAPNDVLTGGTLELSATATDNVGVASVAFHVDGVPIASAAQPPYSVAFQLPAMTPGTLLAVEARATDYSGQTAAARATVRVSRAGQGLIAGEVYDDSTGLPLSGAALALHVHGSPGGALLTTVSDGRGRYSLITAAGHYLLRVTKSGWTSADRIVTVEADRTSELFDARLTPVGSAAAALSPVLGGVVDVAASAYAAVWRREGPQAVANASATTSAAGVSLRVNPGALMRETTLRLTPVSRQGLQGLTPPGWSPVAAVDVTPHGVAFTSPAALQAPNALGIGNRPTVAATWDEQATAWRAVAVVTPAEGTVAVDIAASGQFAWLVADALPAAPLMPAAGALLAGVDAVEVSADATAVVNPQPRIAFYEPGVHSAVRGTIANDAPLPSGTTVLSRITESYAFKDGSGSNPDPFQQDLVLYQLSADGRTLGASYVVSPSLTFDPLAFDAGVISVDLRAPEADEREWTVVTGDGATAVGRNGESVSVPAGAALDRVAVGVQTLTAGELGFAMPGLEFVGAVLLELAGGSLQAPATLSVPRPATIFDGTGLLLGRIEIVGGATRLILVGVGTVAEDRIVSATVLPGLPAPFDGVRVGGLYVFVRATDLIGFSAGRVFGASGAAFAGALVTTDTLPIAARSGGGGTYVAAAHVGQVSLEAVDVARQDRGGAQGVIPAAGNVIAVDLRLAAERPHVVSMTPANGAASVSVATPIVVTFSEAIDAASISGANAENIALVAEGGAAIAGAVALSATQSTLAFRPLQPLAPDTQYTLTLSAAIADLAGTTMGAPVVSRFSSLDTRPPPPPPAGSLGASIPQADGLTTVTGTQGTAATHDTVVVANVTRKTFTPVLLNPNGGFSVGVAAGPYDKLQIEIVDRAGNKTVAPVPQFSTTNADGSVSAVIAAEGGRVEGPSGINVDVEVGTFPDGAIVTVRAVDEAAFPVQLSVEQRAFFSFAGGVSLDFGGVTPTRDVHLSIPASTADTPQDRWVVGGMQEVGDELVFAVADTARVVDGRIMTESPPCPGVEAATTYGFLKSAPPMGLAFGQISSPGGSALPAIVRLYQPTLSNGVGSVQLPYSLVASPSSKPRLSCIPVMTGRATITPNTQTVVIAADQIRADTRQIVIENQKTHAKLYYPRNVVEYRFVVSGSVTDKYQVAAASGGTLHAVLYRIYEAQTGFVTVQIDVDRVHVAVSEVVVRNLSRQPIIETRFPQSTAEVRIPVSGGAGDGYVVTAVDAAGGVRTVQATIVSPAGPERLVARAREATIDPNTVVFVLTIDPAVSPMDRSNWIRGAVQVDPSLIQLGGFTYRFDGDPQAAYALEVRYHDGRPHFPIAIPRVRLVMADGLSGRVVRTAEIPAPPPDEPMNVGVVSGDTDPPFLTGAPAQLTNFDPATPLIFTFSEGLDRDLARLNITMVDDKGVPVPGEVRLSNGNRTVTFVPAAPLRLGGKYTLRMPGLADGSGNVMAALTLAIKVFQPVPVATPIGNPQFGFVRDVAFLRGPNGDRSHLMAVSSDPNTLLFLDVTDRQNPIRNFGFANDARPSRATVLRGVQGLPLRRPNPCGSALSFTGDLAFVVRSFHRTTEFIDSDTTSMVFFDVTRPDAPCEVGAKLLSQGGSNEPNRTAGAIQGLGDALGVAALKHDRVVTAYAAVPPIGLLSTNVGDNIGPFSYDEQTREALMPGDYYDVIAVGGRLAAVEHTNRTVDFLDPGLALQHSVAVGIAGRRLVSADGWPIDRNGNGRIDADESFNLVFVGGEGNSLVVIDVTNPANPFIISRVPVPGAIFELAVDPGKRRILAGGNRPAHANDFGIFLIDFSGPNAFGGGDRDGDGEDDRIIWQSPAGLYGLAGATIRAMRFDPDRRQLYISVPPAAGQPDGTIATWSFDLECCDLAVDMTAPLPWREPGGNRGDLLAREKKALQIGIAAGLDKAVAACGVPFRATGAPQTPDMASIFEQGSGSCIWKPNPLSSCGTAYQPGLSDHDYEVYMAEKFFTMPAPGGKPGEAAAICAVRELGEQFTNEDGTPKEIEVGGGVKVKFDDITFFPFVKEHFESARLNINPPKNPGGDPTGDLAMGRQQLLLLWLLGGEYIHLPTYAVDGRPLDEILEDMKNMTGIPRLEGYEWANLQRFNLLKTKAFLRIKDASNPRSSFHDLFVKQYHDAAKSAIRTTFALMVADELASRMVLNVRRTAASPGTGPAYNADACLTITSPDPTTWRGKRCEAFEEYVASVAARTVLDAQLPLFTADQIYKQIHRFWRIKGDVEKIESDAAADAFIADVATFIGGIDGDVDPVGGVIARTKQIYEDTVDIPDPFTPRCEAPDRDASVCRRDNLKAVQKKIREASKGISLHVVPRVSNTGYVSAAQVQVEMYRGSGSGPGVPVADRANPKTPAIRVDLAGNEEKFLATGADLVGADEFDFPTAAERNLNDLPRLDHGRKKPIFELGNKKACGATPPDPDCARNPTLDLTAAPPKWVAFTIDLPERRKKEANRQNNYEGFFYYVLDRSNPAPPAMPPKVLYPLADQSLLLPDPECQAPANVDLLQSLTVSGTTFMQTVNLNPRESATLQFEVRNHSGSSMTNAHVCSSLTGQCHAAGSIAPGSRGLVTVPYIAPAESKVIEAIVSVTAPEIGIRLGNTLRLNVACEAYSIAPLDPDPNPTGPGGVAVSTVEQRGRAFRYYRIIDRHTGQPLANAPLKAAIEVPGRPPQILDFMTNGEGLVVSSDAPAMAIEYPQNVPPNTAVTVRFVEINGLIGGCMTSTVFGLDLKERAFSGTIKGGAALQAEGKLEGVNLAVKAGYGLYGKLNGTTSGDKSLVFGRLLSNSGSVGFKHKNKNPFELAFEASVKQAEGSVGVTSVQMTKDEHTFAWPLTNSDLFKVAALTVESTYGIGLSTIPAGPVAFRVIDELFERVTGLDQTRTLFGTSSALGMEAGGRLTGLNMTLGKANVVNPKINTALGLSVGASASGEAAVVLSVDFLPKETPVRADAGVEYRGEVNWQLGANVALASELAKAAGDPRKHEEILAKLAKTLDFVQSLLNTTGSLAGNLKFTVHVDAEHVKVKGVSFSIAQRKQYGFKFLGDKLVDQGDGNTRTLTFRITDRDPAKLQKAIEQVALVQAALVGTALAGPVLSPPILGPNLLSEQLATLIGYADEYEITFVKGRGVPIPFSLSSLLKGTAYADASLGATINFDSVTEYVIERGVVRRGGMHPLERYRDHDPFVPATTADKVLDVIHSAKSAAESVVTAVKKASELVARAKTFISTRFSPSGVDLEIDGAAEPEGQPPFEVSLFAFQYTGVSGPLAPIVQHAADVGGPADRPHYGIGGFFQFIPEGRVLAGPAKLTIHYLDPEVASVDESSLAIYRWNYQRGDWDLVAGTVDATANNVTAMVNVLGLYTVAPRMPAGAITFTRQVEAPIDPLQPTTATFTSGAVRMNTGEIVPNGTSFTVHALVPDTNTLAPIGTMVTADADPVADGVQVLSVNGSIQFTVTFPPGMTMPRIVAFPSRGGTAFGNQVVPLR